MLQNDEIEVRPLIDQEGFRLNVGIVLVNRNNKLFWAKRMGMKNAWQFPQGGMNSQETPIQAMYRELTEELGLHAEDVELLAESADWTFYRLPKKFIRRDSKPLCIGQKQKWFLLRLISGDHHVKLKHSEKPEFDAWRWVDYWYPVDHVIAFKREVYQDVLQEFEKYL